MALAIDKEPTFFRFAHRWMQVSSR